MTIHIIPFLPPLFPAATFIITCISHIFLPVIIISSTQLQEPNPPKKSSGEQVSAGTSVQNAKHNPGAHSPAAAEAGLREFTRQRVQSRRG